jgi:hypothetical protein
MKRSLATASFLIAALLFSIVPSNAAIWSPNITPPGSNLIGVNIVDSFFNTGENVSTLTAQGVPRINPDGTPNARLCKAIGVAPCDKADQTFVANLLLPVCKVATEQWCIESLSVRKKDEPVSKTATFIRQVNSQQVPDTPGDGLPGGSSVSLWRADGMKNSGGAETYAVYVVLKATKFPGRGPIFDEFTAMVLPYSDKSGFQYESPFAEEMTLPNGTIRIGTRGSDGACAWTETGLCGLMEDFPEGVRASLTLRVSNQLTGWLMGRMADPTISVEQFDVEQNKIVIDAEPVKVPKFYAVTDRSKATPEILQSLPRNSDFSGVTNSRANEMGAFITINNWKEIAKDTAAGVVSTWSATTIINGFGSQCLADKTKLLGIVTTNAMVYEGTAPRFENSTLNYQVGGMHLNPDGSVFQGSYDLLMRKGTAQCLYGFTDAPITATVTVVDAGKEQRIETSSLQELGTGTDKWLKLSARGFTFSSPTLKIKLNQDKLVAPVATPAQSAPAENNSQQAAPAPAPKMAVKKSITCVKGKVTRKVVGTNPKCPAGFKKR